MSFADDTDDGQRRRKSQEETENESVNAAGRKKRRAAPEYGSALRSAYQRTLDEDIPPEMLDLLGKLG